MNELCKKHVDSCRFCWMCRHICPIGNATGLERNNARARALGLSLVNRGVFDISDVADTLYECALCGACTKECVTGWDPVMFTKAARLDAALAGKLPAKIAQLTANAVETGNAYGQKAPDAALAAAFAAHAAGTDTLFFLGADARYRAGGVAAKAITAMEKTGVPFTVLKDEPASGAQLDYLIGAAEETRNQALACLAVLNAYKTVVVYDPADAVMIKRTYGEWGLTLTATVVTYSAFLAERFAAAALPVPQTGGTLTYQDPFALARDLGETEEARKIVNAAGHTVEMLCNRKDTMWAGNILMSEWMPDVIARVAADRIINAKNVGADTIVCASVSEYASLKNAAPAGFSVRTLSDLIVG